MQLPAGSEIAYTITHLEMTKRPDYDWPRLPARSAAALLKAAKPPLWYFFALYDAVGRQYVWEDMHQLPEDDVRQWLQADGMALYSLMEHGWPQGFFMLEDKGDGHIDLAFLGLVPEAVGQGLGHWLVQTAILMAWDRPGTCRLTIQTCTLDHPRALALYQKMGFTPVRREEKTRVLLRDLNQTAR